MSRSLKSKTLHGLFWSFFERVGQQGIQFIILIILARLLLPEQFGLIAMLTIFMAIAQSFINSGFGQALIQKKNATHVDECSIFYFNIFVGFLAAGLLCLAAPWIADFYNQPLLTPLTRVLSLNLIINAFGLVQTTLLTKHIDFKTQLKVSMIATFLSGTIGVTMAFKGFGVWSLVAQSLSSNLFRTALLWVFHRWRPAWAFSYASLRIMFAFGSKLLCASLIHTIFDNMYLIVIGKVFSAGDLGFYSRAKRIQQLPVMNISTSVGRVSFPVFSSIQEDKARLKRGVRKALTTLAMINFPMMIGLAIVARPLVIVLLTDKWLPCVPYLQLHCAVGALYPLHVINLNVLIAQGRSDLNLRINILKNAMRIVALVITLRWGIDAIIYGQIAVSLLTYVVNSHYTAKLIDYPIQEQVGDILPYLGVAVTMGVGVHAIHYTGLANNVLLLTTLQILSGAALFMVLCAALRLQVFVEIWQMAKIKILLFLCVWRQRILGQRLNR
ncbi:MAG: lipopolysaccharide biosynthesis protein [Thiotrichaceae bacterium]